MKGIPKHAKRKFKGVIFDVYQWPQKMFDGSTAKFEKVVRQNTVVIIPTVGDKIVILKQKQPGFDWFFDLPSGRMDKLGEKPKEAALRELIEETGLKPTAIRLWKTYCPSGKVIQNIYFYIARDCKKVAEQRLDSGEKIKVFYKTFDEFLKLSDHPRCFFGPLMIDVLKARIHKTKYRDLKNKFFAS